jgi:hypothetical protein
MSSTFIAPPNISAALVHCLYATYHDHDDPLRASFCGSAPDRGLSTKSLSSSWFHGCTGTTGEGGRSTFFTLVMARVSRDTALVYLQATSNSKQASPNAIVNYHSRLMHVIQILRQERN